MYVCAIVKCVDVQDWVYASGWDRTPQQTKLCSGFTLPSVPAPGAEGGMVVSLANPLEQAAGNRAVVFLVETSDSKRPGDSSWGQSQEVRC